MSVGATINNGGKKISLDRTYNASPTYTPPSRLWIGIENLTPAVTDTDLAVPVPISNGTVNDTCEDTFTGSAGGDNSTDNTTTYKDGAGTSDVTSQNLISNTSSASKTWTLTPDTNFTATQPVAFWLYIKDATTLAYLLDSGTAVEARFGSDASNYYSKTWTAANISTGWNWMTTGSTNVEDLTETGTVTGNIDTFVLIITTDNATDSWSSGDVIIDCIRQWATTDLYVDIASGYPSVDETTFQATMRGRIGPSSAVGFELNGYAWKNTDSTPLLFSEITSGAIAKTTTVEVVVISKDKL